MSVGDLVKKEAEEFIAQGGTGGQGPPLVILGNGLTKMRMYFDSKSQRLIRSFQVHSIDGKHFWCAGEQACPFCLKVNECSKKYNWQGAYKLGSYELNLAYGCIYEAGWQSEYLKLNIPVVISIHWRLKRAIMEYFATIDDKLLDGWFNPEVENYILVVNLQKGQGGSASAGFDPGTKKIMPSFPQEAPPLTEVWIKENQIYEMTDVNVQKALAFIEKQAQVAHSLKQEGTPVTTPPAEEPQHIQTTQPTETAPPPPPVTEAPPVEQPSAGPKPQEPAEGHLQGEREQWIAQMQARAGCSDSFGKHKGAGTPECILCDVEKECMQLTKKAQKAIEDDIPF